MFRFKALRSNMGPNVAEVPGKPAMAAPQRRMAEPPRQVAVTGKIAEVENGAGSAGTDPYGALRPAQIDIFVQLQAYRTIC